MKGSLATTQGRDPYTFVLWGDQFDSVTASIFITQFRRSGIKTKVLAIHGPHITGQHGVILQPDMVLGDAIPHASETICIVLPSELIAAQRLQEDPRLMQFLREALMSNALLIAKNREIFIETALGTLHVDESQIAYYAKVSSRIEFAEEQAKIAKQRTALVGKCSR